MFCCTLVPKSPYTKQCNFRSTAVKQIQGRGSLNDWWIHKGRISASGNPTDKELEDLRGQGFAAVISLLDEQQQKLRYNVADAERAGWVRHDLPIREGEAPSLDQLERFRKIIQALPPNAKVLIHCSTGRGRAATFGAAYWIMRGSSATEAIKSIEKAGYQDWETPERTVVLGEFAEHRNREAQRSEKGAMT